MELFGVSLCPAYLGVARRFRPDLVHAHFPNPLADLACLFTPRRIPVVLSWHSDIVRQKSVMALYRPLQQALLRRATKVVVATPFHLQYSSWLGPFSEKVEVIPFGLDLQRFGAPDPEPEAVDRLRSKAQGRAILLNVGRLVGYKGQRHAVTALKSVPDAELWLVGKGPLEAGLRQQAAELGVADRLRFFGDVADNELPRFYRACDLFVFPSETPNEAFGLVQVEAMACGKPVVACNLRSGVPYVCRDGETGLIVPPGDSERLALAIRRLLADKELARRLGGQARDRALREFEESVMVERYLDLFRRLVAEAAHD
jgi:rhamnosyl/mannosyltransferase